LDKNNINERKNKMKTAVNAALIIASALASPIVGANNILTKGWQLQKPIISKNIWKRTT
jgi:hypothetical protein